MAKGGLTLGSDYSSVWEQLNLARTRLGVSALNVPDVDGSHATSAQMKKMEADIEATRVSDSRISSAFGSTTLTNIDVGDVMLYNVITQALDVAVDYQGVPICSCQGHQSDDSDRDGALSQCSCYVDDGGCGREQCTYDCTCYGYCDAHDGEYINSN